VSPPPTEAPPTHARFWIGVSGAIDFVVMPAATDVCKLTPGLVPQQSNSLYTLYCTNPDGSDFPSATTNTQLSPGNAGQLSDSVQPGDVRVMLTLDDAVADNILIGVRLGVVLNSYTGNAAIRDGRALGPPVHAELRLTYVFGQDPLSHEGFSPTVFVGGGVSEFDARTSTQVKLNNVVGTQPVDVWVTDGPFFLTSGGGVRYQFSQRLQVTLAARLNAAFHGNGFLPSLGPELTVQYGF
jgi:hypothetical protein